MLIVRHLGAPNSDFNGYHCMRDPVLCRSMVESAYIVSAGERSCASVKNKGSFGIPIYRKYWYLIQYLYMGITFLVVPKLPMYRNFLVYKYTANFSI